MTFGVMKVTSRGGHLYVITFLLLKMNIFVWHLMVRRYWGSDAKDVGSLWMWCDIK